MYNFHPPLSSFPVALISVVFLLELIALFKPGPLINFTLKVNISLAALFTIAAFVSGYQGSDLANQTFTIADDVIEKHHQVGWFLLFIIIPCAGLRCLVDRAHFHVKALKIVYWVMLLACISLVTYCGYLGGQLVFVHGAGVKAQLETNSSPK